MHVDINRPVTGNVTVYVDTVLLMDVEGSQYLEGNNLSYWAPKGGKLDNISVYDTMIIDPDEPTSPTDTEGNGIDLPVEMFMIPLILIPIIRRKPNRTAS